ncbi:MAG: S-layer homology domain-containing protein [Acidimicrobiia bacterium]
MLSKRFRIGVLLTAILTTFGTGLDAAAEAVEPRGFEDETWTEGWVDLRPLDLIRAGLVTPGFAGNGLGVGIPVGGFRGFGPFDRFDEAEMGDAWYRYHIRLLSWNSASSGKLPGLSGLYSSSGRGCIPSEPGTPGWSARGLFGAVGTQGAPPGNVPIGTYLYHVDQPGICGELLYWPGASLEQGRWQCIEGHIKLNSLGSNDGMVEGWLDGVKRFTRSGVAFRRADETQVGIRDMWHNIYFGGSWPTPNPLSLILDEVEVSTEGRVGCMDPFTDDNDSLHVKGLTELHARGLLFGCAYRKVCPERLLTRGEAAALFSRVFSLPAPSKDFFTDDQGHLFEGAINKLAAAGITVGCTPVAFCPDDRLTRAQFATMTVRALGLPASGPDAFTDDNGHWAEGAINTFADFGLTEGCGENRFCPNRILSREEAASFFLRVADRIEPLGLASVEPPPDWPPPGDPAPIPPEERD